MNFWIFEHLAKQIIKNCANFSLYFLSFLGLLKRFRVREVLGHKKELNLLIPLMYMRNLKIRHLNLRILMLKLIEMISITSGCLRLQIDISKIDTEKCASLMPSRKRKSRSLIRIVTKSNLWPMIWRQ